MNTKKTIGESNIVGTCLKMCPEKEAKSHKIDELSPFEIDPITNEFSEDLAITTFHRSEANKKFKPEEIRPLPILQKTMKHILNYVIGQRLNTSKNTSEIDLYMYLRGRFRAICTDITVQHLEGEEIIELYQTMILFFIWSGARFPNICDVDTFDTIMNLQTLTNMFSSLDEQYEKYFKKTGIRHPLEPDFRSFHLLKYISNDAAQFMAQLLLIPKEIVETKAVKNVIKLRQAVISNNLPDFIQIIDSTPIQFGVMALQNVPSFYYNIFLTMKKALGRFKFNKDFFTLFLDLPNEYFQLFAKNFQITNDPNNQNSNLYSFQTNSKPSIREQPQLPLPLTIKRRYERSPLLDFMIFKPTSKINLTIPPKIESKSEVESEVNIIAENEVNDEEQIEATDVNNISSQQSDFQPIIFKPPPPKPFIFKKIETPEKKEEEIAIEEIEAPEEKPPLFPSPPIQSSPISKPDLESTRENVESGLEEQVMPFTCTMKMKKRVLKPQLFNYMSMIPSALPPYCFISIVINDSDGSSSAVFARSCFNNVKLIDSPINKENNIVYLGNFRMASSICPKSHIYMSIVRRQLQKYMNSVGAILHCEDTTSYEENEVPFFTFSLANSKSSPELILNNLIRKCIETAVVEFQPMNLTDIVRSALSLTLNIALSPDWYNASCNAVLELFNSVYESLANIFESELFMRYLLPFIHNQIGPKDMRDFSSSIRKMRFPLIDKDESTKPRLDSTWPIYIRDSMKITTITPFIAPVSVKFDPQDFLSLVISPFEDSLPYECVKPQEEKISYVDILHSFDCDLYE